MSVSRLKPIKIILSENGVKRDYEIARVCTIKDPRYGIVPITKETLLQFKENFEKGVRGIEICVDFEHKVDDGAAGWFKKVYLAEDGERLRAEIDWTPDGEAALKGKKYAYFSPDFEFNYEDNETGENFGPVLKGAALTNRPVIKRMEPAIELSEGDVMKIELEKLQAENKDLKAQTVKLNEQVQAMEQKLADPAQSPEALLKVIEELKAENAKLKESVGQMNEAKQLAEKKAQFQKLLTEGKAVPAQEDAFIKGDTIKFAELAGSPNLGNKGHGGQGPESVEDPEAEVIKLAEAKVKESGGKLQFAEAVSQVRQEKPDLWKEARK